MVKTILFLCPPELGHLLPTIEVGRTLAALGHRIIYLTASHFGPLLNSFGFEILGLLPPEYESEPMLKSAWTYWYAYESITGLRAGLALLQRLRDVVSAIHVHGIVTDTLYVDSYGKELRKFLTSFPTFALGITLPNWTHTTTSYSDIPRAYLCPIEFELPQFRHHEHWIHYAEPSVLRQPDQPSSLPLSRRNDSVFVAFGSQSAMHNDLSSRLGMITDLAKLYREYTFYLSAISALTPSFCEALPENVSVVPFGNQHLYLSQVKFFITHGGLGSIKEGILEGTPMLVLPRLFDQPFNAVRVETHRIGCAVFPEELSADSLERSFAHLTESTEFAENIGRFQQLMIHAERNRRAATLILKRLD